jgi:ubiquinone/menaquinone biosynthesis C-methylase UbiE
MKTPNQFYKELGAQKLAERKLPSHTKKELSYLKKILGKKQKILDLACGYGRFTIPLAKQGYGIEGIDISPNLISRARRDARGIGIRFRVGDMTKLPYKNESFHAIICMWSAFNELRTQKDQIKALKEAKRVLKPRGFALFDMPKTRRGKTKWKGDVFALNPKTRLTIANVSGIKSMPIFNHTKGTLREIMKKAGVTNFKIWVHDFGGRERMLMRFEK